MDNKYGLGSAKVAHEHHDAHAKNTAEVEMVCRACGSNQLTLSLTLHDHRCEVCGEWQNDVTQGYTTGRSADY